MNKKRLSQHGLKWNPFASQLPVEALQITPPVDNFCRRVEHMASEGGFALLTGEPGTGKSATLRILSARLSLVRDLRTGILTRPQSGLADFYRELGDIFGAPLSPHNRWAGTKVLRERWQQHLDTTLYRPVLIVDEAQEMQSAVLNELRLLTSVDLDSRLLLTVVLAGDGRLSTKFRCEELLPLGSRIRVRLNLEAASAAELTGCLRHALECAGNPQLMTKPLIETLAEHAAGNHRVLMSLGADLLAVAGERDLAQLDEKLYFEVFSKPAPPPSERAPANERRSRRTRR